MAFAIWEGRSVTEKILDESEVMRQACEKWGIPSQIVLAIEEMSELTKELCKDLRDRPNLDHIAEEIADVEITVGALVNIYGCANEVEAWKRKKIKRLADRIASEP